MKWSDGQSRAVSFRVSDRVTDVSARWSLSLSCCVVCLFFAFMASSPTANANSPHAEAIAIESRLGGDHEKVRFVVDLDKEVPFRVFTLANPYRVVVDLPQIDFRMGAGAGQRGKGLITAYRYGLLAKNKSRIVLDADRPVLIDKAFILRGKDRRTVRLVMDLVATDQDSFQKQVSRPVASLKRSTRSMTPQIPLPPNSIRRRGVVLPVIVIDPGHGGVDPGAVAPNGVQEKDMVFAFSRMLKRLLDATKKYEVILTRDSDVFLSLAERVEIARDAQSDLFISVHADKFHSSDVRGMTIYTLSEEASDAEAEALAKQENRADVIAGLDLDDDMGAVSDILIDLARRETKNFSVYLAQVMVNNMDGKFKLNKNPHRSAGFRVLTAPDVPSILLELGYISNARDVRDMLSSNWREKAASAICSAVDAYFSTRFVSAGEKNTIADGMRSNKKR